MSRTILSVAYPFAPVGPDTAGGAEQVLSALDAGLVAAGHRSVVVGCEGSVVAGELVAVPRVSGVITERARDEVGAAVRARILDLLANRHVDLIHYHGIDFADHLVDTQVPSLATLHLPPTWYPSSIFDDARPGPWLNPVSAAQLRLCPPGRRLLPAIENGVPVDELQSLRLTRRGFGLVLARICPEKGIHLALDAAKAAGMSLVIAGELFPYEAHQRYFAEEIAPRLDRRRRFVGPVGFARKRRLLAAARCLLVPSLVDETSSLVAREAAACGTPVVALARGALREAVVDGVTGYLVEDAEGMGRAMVRTDQLDPELARDVARRRFRREDMVARYLALHADLASRRPARPGPAPPGWALPDAAQPRLMTPSGARGGA
jgi:glycosyltransferase involved in cell wall biosynthesis